MKVITTTTFTTTTPRKKEPNDCNDITFINIINNSIRNIRLVKLKTKKKKDKETMTSHHSQLQQQQQQNQQQVPSQQSTPLVNKERRSPEPNYDQDDERVVVYPKTNYLSIPSLSSPPPPGGTPLLVTSTGSLGQHSQSQNQQRPSVSRRRTNSRQRMQQHPQQYFDTYDACSSTTPNKNNAMYSPPTPILLSRSIQGFDDNQLNSKPTCHQQFLQTSPSHDDEPNCYQNGHKNTTSGTVVSTESRMMNAMHASTNNNINNINCHNLDDVIDTEEEDHILKVVDHVEDEWEEVAYDNLVPLEVRLALERNIFGWSHLSSDIVGHCLFTAGAFSITFVTLYVIEKQQHRHQSAGQSFLLLCIRWLISIAAAWSSFRMVRRRRRIWLRAPYGSMKYKLDEARRRLEVEQTDNLTWIQRMKAQHGKRKLQKQLRKAESNFLKLYNQRLTRVAASTTCTTNTINNNYQQFTDAISPQPNQTSIDTSSIQSNNMDRGDDKEYNASELVSSSSKTAMTSGTLSFRTDSLLVMQSVQQDQIIFRNGPIHRVPYSHGGGFGAAPFMLANPHWISVLRYLMPDVYVEISRRVISAPPHKLLHWAENNPVVAAYASAHQLENTGSITNIEWDVFLDPHLVNRVEIVLQERQKFLLSVLPELPTLRPMEKLSDEYLSQMNLSPSQQNVVRYYESQLRKRTQLLVDRMLIAHGNLMQLAVEQTGAWKYYNYSRVKRTRRTLGGGIFARQWVAVYAESLRVGLRSSSHNNSGSTTSSSAPSSPVPPSYSMSRSNTPQKPTAESGTSEPSSPDQNNATTTTSTAPTVTATSIYSSSISQPTVQQQKGQQQEDKQQPQQNTTKIKNKPTSWLMESTNSVCPNTSIAASIAMIKHITKIEEPIGLVLDVKSRHVSNQVWACVVDILRESGVRVEGVGSFVMDEIRTLSKFTVRPVREMQFFHSAGDLQQACHNKTIRYGDHVFFNGGCLIWSPRFEHLPACTTVRKVLGPFNPTEFQRHYRMQPYALPASSPQRKIPTPLNALQSTVDGSYQPLYDGNNSNPMGVSDSLVFGSTIEDYKKRYNLRIGLYVQEFAIDNVAIDMLVNLVNSYPDLYDLGLSWGGVNGITLRGIQPGRFTETTGYWNQRYLGHPWNPELRPPI